jgi:nucleoside-diphosphate-sugar epimerase
VTGDITEENLGLKETFVNQHISELWHIAARVQFTEMNREKVLETNVRGGRNILKFIRQNNIPVLNFISTAYVAGKKTGNIKECFADEKFPVNNVYEQSKRIVEQEIVEASITGGFTYRIFRPSIIVGHSVTYQPDYCNGGLYGFLYLYALIENQIIDRNTSYSKTDRIKLLGDKNSTLSLISIDHVVNSLFQIANQEGAANQIYHITPPVEIRLEKIVEIVNSLFQLQMELATTNEDYNGNDRLFNRQVNHYRPYLFYEKHFERRDIRNCGNDPYNLDDKKLYKLIENFYLKCKTES